MERIIKEIIKTFLPFELRSQTHLDNLLGSSEVKSGIFAGLNYVVEAVGSSLLPKLIGCYEKELSSIFESLRNRNINVIFDIGAAEGYYAVGLARMLPRCQVIAFEATQQGRDLLAEMARKNFVKDRIEIHGMCTKEIFETFVASRMPDFVLIDIEGGEQMLESADLARKLGHVEMLIEVHPANVPGIENALIGAFTQSHIVREIFPATRTFADFWRKLSVLQRVFCGKTLLAFMGEGRGLGGSHWLHLLPRTKREPARLKPEH